MSKKILQSNKGLTLIELLAALALVSIIGLTVYSVLFGGLKSYNRVMAENELRDEGDYIMAYLLSEFYTLKASDITEKRLPQTGTKDYYIIKKDGTKSGIIGSEIILNDKQITMSNDNVTLTNESFISADPRSQSILEITLVLKHDKSNKKIKLNSILRIVNDKKEG